MNVGERCMCMNIAQRATAQRRERPKPKYIARAKVNNGWVSVGAAWEFRSGEQGLSIQLTTIPLNWDGRFVLLPPLENEEVAQEPEELTQQSFSVPGARSRKKDAE